jgi:hypothetical protein
LAYEANANHTTDSTNMDRTTAAGNTDTTDTSTSGVSGSGSTQTDGPGNTPATAPIRPEDEPGSDEHSRIQEAKKEAEDAQNVDTSCPGPKPLSETRKAGDEAPSSGGDDDGPQKESHGEGTGEKYVKSSGMKADGGDFDAASAGAGKEADRPYNQST